MRLLEIRIKNYRLLIDAKLDVDAKTTLIVGRNNTAKTSCSSCINTVLQGSDFSYNDYPLSKRESLHNLFLQFMEKKLSYEDLCEKIETISVEFLWIFQKSDMHKNPNLELYIRTLMFLLKKMPTIWISSRNTLRLADAICSLQIKLFLLKVLQSG